MKLFSSLHLLFVQNASMPRMFRLFRGLGLRHLIIVDEENKVNQNLWKLVENFKLF